MTHALSRGIGVRFPILSLAWGMRRVEGPCNADEYIIGRVECFGCVVTDFWAHFSPFYIEFRTYCLRIPLPCYSPMTFFSLSLFLPFIHRPFLPSLSLPESLPLHVQFVCGSSYF